MLAALRCTVLPSQVVRLKIQNRTLAARGTRGVVLSGDRLASSLPHASIALDAKWLLLAQTPPETDAVAASACASAASAKPSPTTRRRVRAEADFGRPFGGGAGGPLPTGRALCIACDGCSPRDTAALAAPELTHALGVRRGKLYSPVGTLAAKAIEVPAPMPN